MNPAAQIATALLPWLDPALAGLAGTLGFLAGLFGLAALGAVLACGKGADQ